MKKVVILMPCYNSGEYIEETLLSLTRQTMAEYDYDIMIVDDGSTDNTVDVVRGFMKNNKNIFLKARGNNIGIVRTRNELLIQARGRGEYIAWCDSDDIYSRNKLKMQYDFLKNNPEFVGCGTWYKRFGKVHKYNFSFVNPVAVNTFTLFGSPIGFPTMMHRNNLPIMFDETLSSSEDYDYISRLLDVGPLTNIRRVMTYYRVHDKQESTQYKSRQYDNHVFISMRNQKSRCIKNLSFQRWVCNPKVNNRHELSEYYAFIKSLYPADKMLIAIFDYRFLSYNKNNLRVLLRASLKRFIFFLNVIKLYLR
jgi:glycosyltransferase involved in cell wall biosynthesis